MLVLPPEKKIPQNLKNALLLGPLCLLLAAIRNRTDDSLFPLINVYVPDFCYFAKHIHCVELFCGRSSKGQKGKQIFMIIRGRKLSGGGQKCSRRWRIHTYIYTAVYVCMYGIGRPGSERWVSKGLWDGNNAGRRSAASPEATLLLPALQEYVNRPNKFIWILHLPCPRDVDMCAYIHMYKYIRTYVTV